MKKTNDSAEKSEIVSAKRIHVGMMDIIDHIGTVSGIDDAITGIQDITYEFQK